MGKARYMLDTWLNRRESWVWVLGLGILLRLLFLFLSAGTPLSGDALSYHQVAGKLMGGDLSDVYWPPGLPLFEAGIGFIFGASPLVARISMLFWFAWLGRGTYNLVQRIHSRPAANLALAFLCIYPEFIHHSIEPLTHLPTAALVVCMVNLLLRYTDQHSSRSLGWLGLVLGMLILLRPASLLLALLVPGWMFFRRRSAFAAFYVMAIAFSVAGAWVHLASNAHGRLIPVNEANSRNLYLGNNSWTPDYKTWYLGSHWAGESNIPPAFRAELDSLDHIPPADRGAAFLHAAATHIKADPARFLVRTANRFRVFFAFDSFTGARLHPPTGTHALAGKLVLALDALLFTLLMTLWGWMLAGLWKGETTGMTKLLLTLVIAVYALPYLFSFSHPGYHMAVMPLMLAFASIPCAVFLLPMGRPFQWPQGRKAWTSLAVFVVVVAVQLEWVLRMRA